MASAILIARPEVERGGKPGISLRQLRDLSWEKSLNLASERKVPLSPCHNISGSWTMSVSRRTNFESPAS